MKLVYLHGIGDGDTDRDWLLALNRGLAQIGKRAIDDADIIAPQYSSYLNAQDVKAAKHPPRTFSGKGGHDERRAFERRQARVQRMLGRTGMVQTFGFGRVPGPVINSVQSAAIELGPGILAQVKTYMNDESVRGAILRRILDFMPPSGDIILIGHSLGSVIAIDLLDHLPEKVHVRRFITLGSPAGSEALHSGSDRILKHFPYARVDDWSNFLDCRDPVTAGRGLTRIFPGAQDFGISGATKHSAHYYMSCPAVPTLVAEILFPSIDLVPSETGIVLRLDDAAASSLLTLKYGHHVANKIDNDKVRERYEDALAILQDNFAQELIARSEGRQLPPELTELTKGRVPTLPHRWELPEAVGQAVTLAFTNVLDPYEVDVDEARVQAIVGLFLDLGFTRKTGQKVADATKEVADLVSGRQGLSTMTKLFAAAAGIALLAAGPVGIAMAGATGAAGAAAITSGLAAFGPGGMIGGLAMLGGLSSTGAMVATFAATSTAGTQPPLVNPTSIAIQVSIAYALKSIGEPHDEGLWYRMTEAESEIGAEINRLTPLSDNDSPSLKRLREALSTIERLMSFLEEKGMLPQTVMHALSGVPALPETTT